MSLPKKPSQLSEKKPMSEDGIFGEKKKTVEQQK
ncbi:hypothetical protein DICVIV_14316 [Dictyocaulus viviparus]|uniref:Uncharacterized protein n=1 Tax=Dictyocaulus viviparus TaxID=29172 RepID=A0A0D8X5J4_DICVI|nr:hypothetical protein DICVIV_14316 [Dictyocaulus viviparus]